VVLRDLVARIGQLSRSEQAKARAVIARPTSAAGGGKHYQVPEATPDCTLHVCVHYVMSTTDAPSLADTDANGIPDFVETVASVFENVWANEIDRLGYRPPKSDLASTDHGPDGKLDVYLEDLGSLGYYGYVTTDDPGALSGSYYFGDVSTYAVLDNDYSLTQYTGSASPLFALEVTAAHEFFHTVQAAYNFFADGTLLEGTAVWMEDEVYNDINDNYQYLPESAIAKPGLPFDRGYYPGAFVFFKYLSETYDTPDVIRRIWELDDDSPTGPNQYSIQAIDSMLHAHGSDFRSTFAAFAIANVLPAISYAEGASYPKPALHQSVLGAARPRLSGQATLDNQTSRYFSLLPDPAAPRHAKLHVTLNLPPPAEGSQATLVVIAKSGAHHNVAVSLDPHGRGARTVPFGNRQIAEIVLVLTNASTRYNCGHGTEFACQGIPLDNAAHYRYTAEIMR
jgi:hypothetical protein